jgi:hypothetical protein
MTWLLGMRAFRRPILRRIMSLMMKRIDTFYLRQCGVFNWSNTGAAELPELLAPVLNFIKDEQLTGAGFSMRRFVWRKSVANDVVGMVVLVN